MIRYKRGVSAELRFCTECGARTEGGAFCTECGHRFPAPAADAAGGEATLAGGPASLPFSIPETPTAPVRSLPPAVPPAPWSPAPKRSGGLNPKILIGTLAVILLVGAGVGVGWWLSSRASEPAVAEATPVVASAEPSDEPSEDPSPEPVATTPAAAGDREQIQALVDESRSAADTLSSSDSWTAQLASESAASDDGATRIYASWRRYKAEYPNALMIWSGDWPHVFDEDGNAWVILSGISGSSADDVRDWCESEDQGFDACWARRLSTHGDVGDNTKFFTADDDD